MKKGIQLMSQIARLAREAAGELESEEDRQAAVEIRLAAECVIGANPPARSTEHGTRCPHHD